MGGRSPPSPSSELRRGRGRSRVKPSALREFSGLDGSAQGAFDEAIAVLRRSTNPLRPADPRDIKQMRRAKMRWRLKIGRYRGIFRWDGAVVDFVMFDPRRRVYDRLYERGV